MLRKWLLRKELSELKSAIDRYERVEAAQEFLIEQGRQYVQFQINNPDFKIKIPRSIMGHGYQFAADHLKVKDQQWRRTKDHEDRKLLNRLNKEGRLARSKENNT